MTDALIFLWLIAAGVSIIVLLDWLGRRKTRRTRRDAERRPRHVR